MTGAPKKGESDVLEQTTFFAISDFQRVDLAYMKIQ